MDSSQHQSQALAKCSSDSALMPPPPPSKRQKRPAKVLDEDVYSEALSHIIARDFFPGLLETEAQEEYMEALDSNNNGWIREAGRKLAQVMTPVPGGQRRRVVDTSFTPRRATTNGKTPRTYLGETPGPTPFDSDFDTGDKPDVDINMSLGAFQAKYTSEDNESFNILLDKQNEKRTANYAFFHNGNKIPSARQIAHRAREQKLLGSGSKAPSTALMTTNSAGEERKALSLTQPSEDLNDRPASVDSFPSRQGARNNFMFDPEGVEDTMFTQAQQADLSFKAVQYSATRFPVPTSHSEHAIPPSPSISAIDAAIAGRPRAMESESGYSGVETPRVNGYAFVDSEPSPSELGVPVTDEEADAAEREASLQFLPKVDKSGPNRFQLSECSKREDLHYKLVEKADVGRRRGGRIEKLRSLGITPARTPTPKFGSKSRGAMTPAAQKLAERIGTPRRDGMFGSGDVENSSWTSTSRAKKL